jgi:predicted metal-dependent hydrolase
MEIDSESFDKQFAKGVELFNRKEFFECHDAFEELWQEERSERRLFLQGLIQAAVGCHHLSNGNTTGAISQYNKSLDKLKDYADDYMSLDIKNFRAEIERCLDGACLMHAKDVHYEVADTFFPELRWINPT